MPPHLLQNSHDASTSECWSKDDHEFDTKLQEENKQKEDVDQLAVIRRFKDEEEDEFNASSSLLDIPFHVLEMIMDRCVGVEYLNFRATCRDCRLAAPKIRWGGYTPPTRLQTYSLLAPWLIVLDKNRYIMTFFDPVLGDIYFKGTLILTLFVESIACSRFGWLLVHCLGGDGLMMFVHPFNTDDRHTLKRAPFALDSVCFSAPPTSPDCKVVGSRNGNVYIYSVAKDQRRSNRRWRTIHQDFDGEFHFLTFHGQDIYGLCEEGKLHVFKHKENGDYCWEGVVAEAPASGVYFMAKCDEHVLVLVIVSGFRESVEVYKLKEDSSGKEWEWEKLDSLGRHMIYVCRNTCLCIEAKTRGMENKIYFPQLHSEKENEKEKMVFYSLETCTFNINGSFMATKNSLHLHAWIEPNWSSLFQTAFT